MKANKKHMVKASFARPTRASENIAGYGGVSEKNIVRTKTNFCFFANEVEEKDAKFFYYLLNYNLLKNKQKKEQVCTLLNCKANAKRCNS